MDVGANFRTWLMTVLPEAAERVHEDNAPQLGQLVEGECEAEDIKLFVYFSRTNAERDDCLDAAPTSPDIATFAIEIIGPTMTAVKAAAVKVQNAHGYQGAFGDAEVYSGIFVNDQDDDYEFFNPADTYGLSVVALELEVIF